jgi:hypothetical protein
MSTVRMNGYRFNLNKALEVKGEGHERHVDTDLGELVDAAGKYVNGDKYLNAGELRRGMDDIIAAAGRRRASASDD